MTTLTQEQKSLSNRFLAYTFFSKLFFVGAIWLYFYRIFLTDYQVGILDALAFFIGLCAEVPSGALADRYGRDKMVRIGQLLMGVGLALQAIGGIEAIFIGQTLLMVGVSFSSGADEALFFSRLRFSKESVHWRRLMTQVSQIGLVAVLLATMVGAWVYEKNIYIPWFLSASGMIISALIIWNIKDNRQKYERKSSSLKVGLYEYLREIYTGFQIFTSPRLWMYVPVIIALQGLYYAAGWGLLRLVLLDRFHFSPVEGAWVITISSLLTVLIFSLLHRYADRVPEKEVLTTIGTLTVLALLVSVWNIGMWGAGVIFILYVGTHVILPFLSEVVNHNVPEERRATALSVASFFKSVPYIALAPIIGLLNTRGSLEYFLLVWSAVIVLALVIYLAKKKEDTKYEVFSQAV